MPDPTMPPITSMVASNRPTRRSRRTDAGSGPSNGAASMGIQDLTEPEMYHAARFRGY
jgi:hypothetical protein